jgi:hypothetical protein
MDVWKVDGMSGSSFLMIVSNPLHSRIVDAQWPDLRLHPHQATAAEQSLRRTVPASKRLHWYVSSLDTSCRCSPFLTIDSEWAFALFLSKVSDHFARGEHKSDNDRLQLKDPHAHVFTTMELRTAMLETIAHINAMYKEAITEAVRSLSIIQIA